MSRSGQGMRAWADASRSANMPRQNRTLAAALALVLTVLAASGVVGCSTSNTNTPNGGNGMMNRNGTGTSPNNVPGNTPGGMMNNTTGY